MSGAAITGESGVPPCQGLLDQFRTGGFGILLPQLMQLASPATLIKVSDPQGQVIIVSRSLVKASCQSLSVIRVVFPVIASFDSAVINLF